MAEGQTVATSAHAANEDCTTGHRIDEAARLEAEEPHADTETAQEASKTLRDVREDKRDSAEDNTSEEGGDKEGSLNTIGDRRVHQIDDKNSDGQCGQVRSRAKDVYPIACQRDRWVKLRARTICS